MKRLIACILTLLLAVLPAACILDTADSENKGPQASCPSQTEPVLPLSPVESAAPPEQSAPPAAESEAPVAEEQHSPLYIPGVFVEDVIHYFNEVCLDAEIIHSGDPSVLQKWLTPIHYIVYGTPTEEDISVLSGFTQWLNTIEGFPGIRETSDPAQASLRIHFCDYDEMLSIMGQEFAGMDGAITFWYTDSNEIYDAVICCRTDCGQQVRNSVILEEIYNGLGPIQDTWLRPDSIIYADYSQPQSLNAIDELLLKLLYHPSLECGMDQAACEGAIRELYY